jgi:hypothetical protein
MGGVPAGIACGGGGVSGCGPDDPTRPLPLGRSGAGVGGRGIDWDFGGPAGGRPVLEGRFCGVKAVGVLGRWN